MFPIEKEMQQANTNLLPLLNSINAPGVYIECEGTAESVSEYIERYATAKDEVDVDLRENYKWYIDKNGFIWANDYSLFDGVTWHILFKHGANFNQYT